MNGYSTGTSSIIKWAAFHHDVGKALIPQAILNKNGELTSIEFEIMKLHTIYGYKLLKVIPGERGKIARQIALLHHERYDSKGYFGYNTKELPTYVGIVSICDVYVALRSKRAYKSAWSKEDTINFIISNAGTKFCPKLVRKFILLDGNGLD